MKRNKLFYKKIIYTIFFFTFLPFSFPENLIAKKEEVFSPEYYAKKFMEFSHEFLPHVDQLDKCLFEMDEFEAGDVFIQAEACQKFKSMRPKTMELVQKRLILQTSYSKTIKEFSAHGGLPHKWLNLASETNALEKIDRARKLTTALFDEYVTKYEVFESQLERTEKLKIILLRDAEIKITGLDLDRRLGMLSEDQKKREQHFLKIATSNISSKRRASCITETFTKRYCECIDQNLAWAVDWESFSNLSQMPQSKVGVDRATEDIRSKKMMAGHILNTKKLCEELKS